MILNLNKDLLMRVQSKKTIHCRYSTDELKDTCTNEQHFHEITMNHEYLVYGISTSYYNNKEFIFLIWDKSNQFFWYSAKDFFIIDSQCIYSYYFDFSKKNQRFICSYHEETFNKNHYEQYIDGNKIAEKIAFFSKQLLDISSMVPWHWKRHALQTKQGLTMKATCIANKAEALSFEQQQNLNFEPTTSFNLTIGNKYILYGMHAYKNTVFYLLVGDKPSLPCLYPADLFELIDHLLPIEWYFNITQQNGALWGYKELITNPDHLDRLLRQDPDALALFNIRKQEIDEWERLP